MFRSKKKKKNSLVVSAHNLTYQIVMMDYWSGLAKKHYSECGKKQLWTLNNVQQSPKYVEGSGCLSDCSIIHTQKKTHSHTRTSLILSFQPMKTPHPTLLQPLIHLTNFVHLINHWQTQRVRERKKWNKDGEAGGENLKSTQEQWAVNIMAFSSEEGSSHQ